MRPFMNHETISKEIFSTAYSSGTGTISSWEGALTNLDDGQHTLATKMISAYYCFCLLWGLVGNCHMRILRNLQWFLRGHASDSAHVR